MVRDQVKKFQGAVTELFRELQHLPDDVPPTPVLISAIQGCSFEVHCFGSSADRYRVGCEGWEEWRTELAMILNETMNSICTLLELAAQAIEDAGAERNETDWKSLNPTPATPNSAPTLAPFRQRIYVPSVGWSLSTVLVPVSP